MTRSRVCDTPRMFPHPPACPAPFTAARPASRRTGSRRLRRPCLPAHLGTHRQTGRGWRGTAHLGLGCAGDRRGRRTLRRIARQSRLVQYFDKTRMEITDPNGDQNSIWYVTNGLLVVELMSGRMQIGRQCLRASPIRPRSMWPATRTTPDGADLRRPVPSCLTRRPLADGATITQRVDRDGIGERRPGLAAYERHRRLPVQVPGIDHQIAGGLLGVHELDRRCLRERRVRDRHRSSLTRSTPPATRSPSRTGPR